MKTLKETKRQKDTQRVVEKLLLKKIKSANVQELRALEKKCTRFYNAGCLSGSGFGRLDVKIMEMLAIASTDRE